MTVTPFQRAIPALFVAFISLFAVSAIAAVIWLGIRAENNFRSECKAVGGYTVTDDDGDIECYRGDREIAEFGENSPRDPKRY